MKRRELYGQALPSTLSQISHQGERQTHTVAYDGPLAKAFCKVRIHSRYGSGPTHTKPDLYTFGLGCSYLGKNYIRPIIYHHLLSLW